MLQLLFGVRQAPLGRQPGLGRAKGGATATPGRRLWLRASTRRGPTWLLSYASSLRVFADCISPRDPCSPRGEWSQAGGMQRFTRPETMLQVPIFI